MKRLLPILFCVAIIACSREVSKNFPDIPPENRDYYEQAQQYYLAANYDTAMLYVNRALEVIDTANYRTLANVYVLRSTLFGNLAQFEESMDDALKALAISEQHHLMENKTIALLSVGKIHYMMYNDEKAEVLMLQAKAVAEEYKLQKEMMRITSALGELYNVVGRSNEALPLLTQTLEIAYQLSDTLEIIQNLRSLGSYYINLNRGKKPNEMVKEYQSTAKKYLDDALYLALTIDAPRMINDVKMSLMRWCRVEEDYTKALAYTQEVLKDADPNNHTLLIQIYDHLVAIYAWLGDAEKAIESHQIFYSMMLKQSDDKLHRSLQEMSVKYQTAEKELEIVRQQSEISRQKSLKYMYMGGLSLSGLLLVTLIYVVVLRIRRNRELADINATKDKFFSIISHDLKNPVIAQRNALQLLIENSDRWDSVSLSVYYQKLLKSAEGQVNLLGNLLNWAQVQTGRMPYLPIEFDLTEALRPDINIIKEMAEHKGITFKIFMPDTAFIIGDEIMIATIVRNLLTNAIKFTSTQGEVSLSLNPTIDGKHTLSISDTGTGMTPEQVQNLFRIDRKQSRKGTAGEQGSGLGLIVCRELLQKHGSTLHVESEEGRGSRFWFVLHYFTPPSPPQSPQP